MGVGGAGEDSPEAGAGDGDGDGAREDLEGVEGTGGVLAGLASTGVEDAGVALVGVGGRDPAWGGGAGEGERAGGLPAESVYNPDREGGRPITTSDEESLVALGAILGVVLAALGGRGGS